MRRYTEIQKKDIVKAITVCVLLLVAINGIYIALNRWQKQQYLNSTYSDAIQQFKTIEYNGNTYIQRAGIETYLFMGIDVSGPAKGNKSYIGGGQADTQIILVVDRINRTWQMLQLNRDSMVEVPVLGVTGIELSTEYQQLALAHSYGDGLETSCENNVTTVSRLLQNQTIDGYLSLNLDAISILNDVVGGVEVTVLEDFSAVDSALIEGDTVLLTGEQAVHYLRGRQHVGDETNLSRMERQSQYLTALANKMGQLDSETFLQGYKSVEDYMVTNMENKLLNLISRIQIYTQLESLTIKGENSTDKQGYIAYVIDKDSLQQVIIELFYQPLSN